MVKHPTKFDKNTSTSQVWELKGSPTLPINNRSSESFNIITGDVNAHSPKMSKEEFLDRSHGRISNITGIRDQLHVSKVNMSKDYGSAFKCNPNVFARRDGMFT